MEVFISQYLQRLAASLTPVYAPTKMGCGGHDVTHVLRIVKMEPQIRLVVPIFDHYEYQAAAWFHNGDRSPDFMRTQVPKVGERMGELEHRQFRRLFEIAVRRLLEESPFDHEARERIVDAVVQHGKKHDSPSDSALLQALRLADKWDRFGAMGISSGAAFYGACLLPYDPDHPFGFGSTAEGSMTTLYHNHFRILEWYAMHDGIRALVKLYPEQMRVFLAIVRAWGEEISWRHGIRNQVEDDIRAALGPYYREWEPKG